jgi:UPF0716 protein FxsA
MGLLFFIIFLIWGWAEMSAFIYIGSELGGLLTLLGIFVTAVIGLALLKQQGVSVLNRIRNEMRAGQPPITSIADSISLVVGGFLMLIPGYVTDAIGLMLFVPGIRTIASIYLLQWLGRSQRFTSYFHVDSGFSGTTPRQSRRGHYDDIIEGEFEERPGPGKRIRKDD